MNNFGIFSTVENPKMTDNNSGTLAYFMLIVPKKREYIFHKNGLGSTTYTYIL